MNEERCKQHTVGGHERPSLEPRTSELKDKERNVQREKKTREGMAESDAVEWRGWIERERAQLPF